MIILEGVDKAGKTTLAQRLHKDLGLEIKKSGIPKGNPIPDYILDIQNTRKPVIWDRFIYGEIPYSIVKHRRRYMYEFELLMLELMAMRFPSILVYVRPPREVVLERLKVEGDDYVNVGEVSQLYEEYDEVTCRAHLPIFEYRGDEDYDRLLDTLNSAKILDTVEWLTARDYIAGATPGIGSLSAKYFFVAERLNNIHMYPIVLWGESGKYLFAQLKAAGIRLQDCYFTNAFCSKSRNIEVWDVENFPNPNRRVIGLGKIAMERLDDLGINSFACYHPGYWGRFHKKEAPRYQQALRWACGLSLNQP